MVIRRVRSPFIGGILYPQHDLLRQDRLDHANLSQAKREHVTRTADDLSKSWCVIGRAHAESGFRNRALASFAYARQYGHGIPRNFQQYHQQIAATKRLHIKAFDPEADALLQRCVRTFGPMPVGIANALLENRNLTLGHEGHWSIEPNALGLPVEAGIILPDEAHEVALPIHMGALHLILTQEFFECYAEQQDVLANPFEGERWRQLVQVLTTEQYPDEAKICTVLARHLSPEIRQRETWQHKVVNAWQNPNVTFSILPFEAHIRRVINGYFSRLKAASDAPENLSINNGYAFPPNEFSFRFFMQPQKKRPTMNGIGGCYMGVGTSMYLTHMVRQDATHGYVVDYNRFVTEALLPITGALLIAARNRVEFFCRLFGIKISPEEMSALDAKSNEVIISTLLRSPRDDAYHTAVITDLISILSHHSDNDSRKQFAREFADFFNRFKNDADFHHRLVLLHHFLGDTHSTPGSAFSDEQNFIKARSLWVDERITGISGNWLGTAPNAIARDISQHHREAVGLIYTSNLLDYLSPNELISLEKALRVIPLASNAAVIHTNSGGSNYQLYRPEEFWSFFPDDAKEDDERWVQIWWSRVLHHLGHLPEFLDNLINKKSMVIRSAVTGDFDPLFVGILGELTADPACVDRIAAKHKLSKRKHLRLSLIHEFLTTEDPYAIVRNKMTADDSEDDEQ